VRFTKARNVRVEMPKAALEAVFDECDRYDVDETGGRILGTYEQRGGKLLITVSGIIEPGPAARRSATSFFQDGPYQEKIFRRIEERAPTVEHLGNWHTHHVNGLQHLSGGDVETYRRTVSHSKHNTNFFFALLVTDKKSGKTPLTRYRFKNYLFRRDDPEIYEIPDAAVTLVDSLLVWPESEVPEPKASSEDETVRNTRLFDRDILSRLFPEIAPFMSKALGVYWRGPISLVDGSQVQVVVLEDAAHSRPRYVSNIRNPPTWLERAAHVLGREEFPSCSAALVATERTCNNELFQRSMSGEQR